MGQHAKLPGRNRNIVAVEALDGEAEPNTEKRRERKRSRTAGAGQSNAVTADKPSGV